MSTSSPLWSAVACTANYATAFTNPLTLYRRARRNTRAVVEHKPDLFAGTELWSPLSRSAFYRVLRNGGTYRHHAAGPRQSVVIAWNAARFKVIGSGAFLLHPRVVYGRYRRVIADARWCPWVLLQDRATGRRFYLVGLHMTPPATKRGDVAVRAATRARRDGYANLADWLIAHDGYPVIVLGDFNDEADDVTEALNDRGVYRIRVAGNMPDFILTRHGRNAELRQRDHDVVPLPSSDHDGAVFATVLAVAA
jgi:hypothetical protein